MQIDQVLNQSTKAFKKYKNTSLKERANFLKEVVSCLEEVKEELVPIACEESHLPEGRISGEFGRTTGQIKLFASYIEEGSYLEATVDHGDPARTPAPKPDLRRFLVPIGPVAVFGASNFPLAFSTIGGDSVSALASGCTVVYKGHPSHPKTSLLVFGAIQKALEKSDLPKGVFQLVEGGIEEGQALVKHPLTKAVGFTGSFKGGKALFDLANNREEPIPVYAEMGSTNPIFVTEGMLYGDIERLASQYAQSLTMGVGQFCTNPGIIFIPEKYAHNFAEKAGAVLESIDGQTMLNGGIQKAYSSALGDLAQSEALSWSKKATDTGLGEPALAMTNVQDWLANKSFQEEVFGPFGIVVSYRNQEELHDVAEQLQGQLTITLWAEEKELKELGELISQLQEKCGRLLFGGVPTGVEVGYAMQHGGPYPSTSDSRSTSVGVYAIKRFLRPLALQNCPDRLLPEALKESNPLGIPRVVDGKLVP
ncbi:aldehyde dehydrogenase (NADP(+)) [Echinicola sp. CAU 1574]|uniref:Aldehyde dehydrogenase (NADP(+)) n=1 Tax=Echinicola arenosa TaxID=2774144 RepID=A0ABR9ARB6_9BACT|nr:aldehyde dehydrogenase (NADP(+)) [Echinicola arenosa]MBD8491325.1 aldehyde dehydrogenase (NADP(+)) [Echinicola arenosa]